MGPGHGDELGLALSLQFHPGGVWSSGGTFECPTSFQNETLSSFSETAELRPGLSIGGRLAPWNSVTDANAPEQLHEPLSMWWYVPAVPHLVSETGSDLEAEETVVTSLTGQNHVVLTRGDHTKCWGQAGVCVS